MATPPDTTGPMNFGNPKEFTIKELARAVLRLTNSKSPIIHQPLPQDDPRQRQPDITLARKHIGWEPTVGLDEGLRKTITYFDRLLAEQGHLAT